MLTLISLHPKDDSAKLKEKKKECVKFWGSNVEHSDYRKIILYWILEIC